LLRTAIYINYSVKKLNNPSKRGRHVTAMQVSYYRVSYGK
jgi:hypothetical protein